MEEKNKEGEAMSEGFVITREWLEANVNMGAMTRDQAQALRFPWPLLKGWKHWAVGKTITQDQKERFEMRLKKGPAARSRNEKLCGFDF